jgi:hypothetical protein
MGCYLKIGREARYAETCGRTLIGLLYELDIIACLQSRLKWIRIGCYLKTSQEARLQCEQKRFNLKTGQKARLHPRLQCIQTRFSYNALSGTSYGRATPGIRVFIS